LKLDISSDFEDAASRLPPHRKRAVISALDKFRKEPNLPSLKLRQLKKNPSFYIINALHGDRIILAKISDDHFEVVDCGVHDRVYRVWDR
jgi:hypothetical protein